MGVCPSAAAHIKAVWSRASRALGSAPFASRASTAARLPVRAAVISTVSPPRSAASGSAPAARNRLTRPALPLVAASDSGGTP